MVARMESADINVAIANTTRDRSMLWGSPIEFWDLWGVRLLFFGAIVGVSGLVLSALSAYVLYRVADVAQKALELESKSSGERIAALNNDTAQLQADNLALQKVLLPRHVGLFGLDQEPPAKKWFAGFERWVGTKILIQVVPNDPEAQNLANEIAIVLSKFGWHPEMIDERRSDIGLNLQEGVSVMSPGSYKAWDPDDVTQQLFARLGLAARALAMALTRAGLGVGEYPVSGVNGALIVVDFPPDSDAGKTQYGKFNPPLDGVYVQVGSRPVSLTLQWIAAGRPDASGRPTRPPTTKQ